ncbi:MAG: YqaJ viral recombinase family protein [Planctomycetes bacterium]|nr:YqaJ viral recombinase family protein [Planctomycetota bacterium]
MIISDCEQLSSEWFAEHAGIPGASSFKEFITTTGKLATKTRRDGYLYKMAAEHLSGSKEEGYQSRDMLAGVENEHRARVLWQIINGVEVEQVGMVYPDEQKRYLCSPDGLIDRKEGLEIKRPIDKTQIKYLLENRVPPDYYAQVQGSLLVTGFDVWNFFSWSEGLPPLDLKVGRDEEFIKKLSDALDEFCLELAGVIRRLKEL